MNVSRKPFFLQVFLPCLIGSALGFIGWFYNDAASDSLSIFFSDEQSDFKFRKFDGVAQFDDNEFETVLVAVALVTPKAEILEGQSFALEFDFSTPSTSDGATAQNDIDTSGFRLLDGGNGSTHRRYLARVEASLLLPGADVQPDGYQQVSSDLRAGWLINLPKAGNHAGELRFRDPWRNDEQKYPFSIIVGEEKAPIDWFAQVAAIVALSVGLTNLIKFFWAWKDRERQSHKQDESE